MTGTLEQLCRRLEHFETDEWTIPAILEKEILTPLVIDAGAGALIITKQLEKHGYSALPCDIHDWGYRWKSKVRIFDFLDGKALENSYPGLEKVKFSVMMNPPFSKAEEFVEAALAYGARKVLCFQRFAWWESRDRSEFWAKIRPNRIYVCADRATCWRHDLPRDDAGNRYDPATGRKLEKSSTAHAWFCFEPGHPDGTLLGHIYKKVAHG